MSIIRNSYHSLYGAWRLAHFDAGGMEHLDISEAGFWKSFQAALIGLPFFLILSVLEKHLRAMAWDIMSPGQPLDLHNYYLLQILDYIAIWPTFALAMIPMCRLFKVDDHYAPLIISYNWARIFSIAVLIPPYLMLVIGGFAMTIGGILTFIASIFVLGYQWFVIKTAIGGARLPAAALLIADILIAGIVSFGMTWLFGGFFVGAQ